MLAATSLPFTLALSSFLMVAVAAPTRTHCRCAIISPNSLLSAQDSDFLSTSTPRSADPCSNLGPELEYFRHADPELYRTYINPADSDATPSSDSSQKPLTTTVLMELATRSGFSNLGVSPGGNPAPTQRPTERIVCHSEPEAFTAYKSSAMGLWALQIIVGFAVLACVVEGVALIRDWFSRKDDKYELRLQGEEQQLKAHSAPASDEVFSSDAEKNSQAHPSFDLVLHTGERRIGNVYVVNIRPEYDEDDDEMNRPVM